MTSRKYRFFDTRLFSRRDSLSIQEKEYVFKSVLSQHSRRERKYVFRPFSALSWKTRLAGVFVAVLLLTPLSLVLWKGEKPQDEFYGKGQKVETPFFSISCVGPSGKTVCRRGEKLAFRLHTQFRPLQQTEHLYFSAFARRDADGLIYWYSPANETGESLLLKDLGEEGVLPKGIVLDEAYKPGKYQVFGILTNAPLRRREIRSLLDGTLGDKPGVVQVSKVHFSMEH